MTDDIYLNEDLSKPENRINVALFGLLGHDWLRGWLLSELDLPAEAVIYPSKNYKGVRPDFKIAINDGITLAWVEVEIGANPAQIANYQDLLDEPVKTILGRQSDGGDLSLEEIATFLSEECINSSAIGPQITIQIKHMVRQIERALAGHSSANPPRDNVSNKMWSHCLVAGLKDRLGSKLLDNPENIDIGFLKADTIGPEGFSLRVYSKVARKRELSLLNISQGQNKVVFPSLVRLRRCLPDHGLQIDSYVSFLQNCGLDITDFPEAGKPSLPHYEVLLPKLDDLAECLLALAGWPNR